MRAVAAAVVPALLLAVLFAAACGDTPPESSPIDPPPPGDPGDPGGPGNLGEESFFVESDLLVAYVRSVLEQRIAAFPADQRGNGCLGQCEYADNVLNPAIPIAIQRDLAAVGVTNRVQVFELRTFSNFASEEQLLYRVRVLGPFANSSEDLVRLINDLSNLRTVLFAAVPVAN